MPKREIYECDGCGATKRDVNFWYKVRTVEHTLLPSFAASISIHIFQWAALDECTVPANTGKIEYCCGAACVTKKVAEYLSNQKQSHDAKDKHERLTYSADYGVTG